MNKDSENSSLPYVTGLPEEKIKKLWMLYKERFPEKYRNRLFYVSGTSEEEYRSLSAAIPVFTHQIRESEEWSKFRSGHLYIDMERYWTSHLDDLRYEESGDE